MTTDDEDARERMVTDTIAARGVEDPRVLEAMRKVERHRFVPEAERALAYEDMALPIGTGSGYQAAVLAELGADVYSIERVAALAKRARAQLDEAGYPQVHLRHGDGHDGWPEAAPFRAITMTAAAPEIPPALLEQLALGGRLIAPVGSRSRQSLLVVERTPHGLSEHKVIDVAFVPMLVGLREH